MVKTNKIRLVHCFHNDREEIDALKGSVDQNEPKFMFGFYFYLIVTETINRDLRDAENQTRFFVEVCKNCTEKEPCKFVSKSIPVEIDSLFSHQSHLATYSVRHPESQFVDFGRTFYERSFTPYKAYEIWVKWFMANSQKVSDLIRKQWLRHAQRLQFHIFPVPEDAFAEPTNFLSSPLRCPIFVELRTDLIPENIFHEVIREILVAFGFTLMNCQVHKDRERLKNIHGNEIEPTVQYVHLSGGMFVKFDPQTRKFMWAWNHMLSHRYRAS
uniref:DEPDC5_CTD domain-containing protein n=3 Tax=Bursaphelenchus xylophilus TaxID=6326 RepID=A0A1I7RZM9_BURXY